MSLVSPFLIEDVKESLAAYCAMPHAQRADFKKPTLAKFRKLHAERHPLAVAMRDSVIEAKQETPADLAQMIAEFQAQNAQQAELLASLLNGNGKPTATTTKPVNTRKPAAAPKDGATNRKLWRLNIEGLLEEALEASPKHYITDDAAAETLTAAFGPLA